MAAPGVDSSARSGEDSISQVQQMLDKAIRDIRAVDLEALCILAGRKVLTSHQASPGALCHGFFLCYFQLLCPPMAKQQTDLRLCVP